jgi:PAS domain S-box-containing protein
MGVLLLANRNEEKRFYLGVLPGVMGVAAVLIFFTVIALSVLSFLPIEAVSPKIAVLVRAALLALDAALALILFISILKFSAAKNEADNRAMLMFETTPLCVSSWNKNAKIINCNQETVKLFELSDKREYLNRFYDFSPERQPDGRLSKEKAFELVNKAYLEGYCRFEWMHQTPNGGPLPCEVTLIRIKFRDDYIILAYLRDLRELKAMLNEINRENAKSRAMAHWYKSILNAVPFPITVTDENTNWTFINSAVEKFLGITCKDALGKPCSNWGANICNTEHCGIACARRGLKQTYFSEGDSSYQVDVEILNDLDDKPMGFIEVVQDITNLKLMSKKQADAEAANLAKSAFLAKISHEIRTPMNAVLGISEIQLQNEALLPEVREAINIIYNSGYLLLGIINDILDLSKIEAGKLELSPVEYDVASLINDAVHINIMRYDSKPVEFILLVDEGIPSTLYGDELRIKQILNNLLSNAFKYTDSGTVTFSVSAEFTGPKEAPFNTGDTFVLVFRVNDTGQGMTSEQVDKLFDEYTRFNTDANRKTQGTGLGMSIAKSLVKIMGGEISVESRLGKGSLFIVKLPQKIAGSGVLGREAAENLKQFRLDRGEQYKKNTNIVREYMPYGRVLIVDDVETNLYVAKGLLAPYGLTIETVTSGFEAVEKIKGGASYDIIFMDHFMPEMDGLEVAKILRGLGYERPIIALTANAIAGQAEMFMANGLDGFISKPIDIRQLNATLNKLIRDKYPAEVVEAARKRDKSQYNQDDGALQNTKNSKLAEIFTGDAEKALAVLEAVRQNKYHSANDLKMYVVHVHAMKSALLSIGERELSGYAFKLEDAARKHDITVLSEETPAFLSALRAVIEKYKPQKTDNADIEINDEDMRQLREKLAVIKAACLQYDSIAVKAELAALRQKEWPRLISELLETIAKHLLHSEFAEVAEIAEAVSITGITGVAGTINAAGTTNIEGEQLGG